jgi:hypothetical protein
VVLESSLTLDELHRQALQFTPLLLDLGLALFSLGMKRTKRQ